METKIIPKIIHQIWIGPNKEPSVWIDTIRKDYIKTHQDFEYKLWNDINILEFWDKYPDIKIVYDLEKTWNGKSDILRYIILYEYGGIYIDADSVWVNNKNFNDLIINSKGFFAAYENENTKSLVGGVIGTYKNNHIFINILDHIKNYIYQDGNVVTRKFIRLSKLKGASTLLGPKLFDKYANNSDITIFPTNFFYPISWHGINDSEQHKKMQIPLESYLFQYGYSTNNFSSQFNTFI
jgi:hypothetical protein